MIVRAFASPAITYFSKSTSLRLCTLTLTALLAACGGSGGANHQLSDSSGGGGSGGDGLGGSTTPPPVEETPPPTGWTAGIFQASTTYANRCASPRTGIDPASGSAYLDQAGTLLEENNWLRSWTHELYLWYSEVTDRDPSLYNSTTAYFDVLKTAQTTASGTPKDQFHFYLPTADWVALSQSGVQAGYGLQWAVIAGAPPRDIRIAYTEPNTPATVASLGRGAQLLAIDGIDVVSTNDSAQIDAINAALYPDATGQSHTFTVLDLGAGAPRAVSLTSANITSTPVQNVSTISTATGLVGYLLFNDHIATAEQQLIDAINTLATAGITDLVLDVRYNGGGYLDIASELAYMIAGPTATTGKTFETLQFNAQHPTINPVTGEALAPVPFHPVTQGFSTTPGQALPALNLPRVFVLTGNDTCSASEAIINSLRGIDIEVIQIGSTTCGKPYGFYPADNCGTTYFSIQFKGVNAKGFGDYADGFAPANSGVTLTTSVPGCSIADDYQHALGDAAEGRLAAALNYRVTPACPAASGFVPHGLRQLRQSSGAEIGARKSPWLENRIMR